MQIEYIEIVEQPIWQGKRCGTTVWFSQIGSRLRTVPIWLQLSQVQCGVAVADSKLRCISALNL